METVVVDRRRHPRVPREHTTWRELRLRTGDTLVLLDIAAGGALVESRRRLLPGTAVVVHLASPTRALSLRALVVRCCVCALNAPDGVVYRGALAFVEGDQSVLVPLSSEDEADIVRLESCSSVQFNPGSCRRR